MGIAWSYGEARRTGAYGSRGQLVSYRIYGEGIIPLIIKHLIEQGML